MLPQLEDVVFLRVTVRARGPLVARVCYSHARSAGGALAAHDVVDRVLRPRTHDVVDRAALLRVQRGEEQQQCCPHHTITKGCPRWHASTGVYGDPSPVLERCVGLLSVPKDIDK